jgi:lysozyme
MEEIIKKEIEQIKADESFRAKSYKDKNGFPTIGYGTLLPITDTEKKYIKNPEVLTKDEALFLLVLRLKDGAQALVNTTPIVKKLTKNRQGVLFNMVYQLGIKGLLGFKKMWLAIESSDYAKAADEMLDSKWAIKDSPNRAKRLMHRMIEG